MANVDMKQVLKQLDELMERQQKMMERYQATSSLEAARSEPQEEPQSSTSVTPEQPVPDERHHVAIPAQETPEETNQARNVSIVSRKRRKPAVKGKPKTPKSPCWKCGDLHFARECPFASHICSGCQHQGHTEDFCPNNKPSTPQQPQPKENANGSLAVPNIGSKRKFVTTELNGTAVKLQLDSASDITIISQDTWTSIGQPAAQPTDESAITASGRTLNLLAEFHTEITNGGVTKRGRVFISENAELGILGIETMDLFELWSIPFSNMVNAGEQRPDQVVAQLKQQFPEVFRSTLGRCTKAQVKLYLKPDARPTYCPKRSVAYAALPKVVAQLQRLQDNGIISRVQFSDWAAPIVVVRKADNISVRICGDYSTGLNNALESDRHPLPHTDDLFVELAGFKNLSEGEGSPTLDHLHQHTGSTLNRYTPNMMSTAEALLGRPVRTILGLLKKPASVTMADTNTVVPPQAVAPQKPASLPKPPKPKPPSLIGLPVGLPTRPIRASKILSWLKPYDIS